MSDKELLDLIYDAANREIELTHKSAELHQRDVAEVIPSIAAVRDAAQGRSESMLMALLGKPDT